MYLRKMQEAKARYRVALELAKRNRGNRLFRYALNLARSARETYLYWRRQEARI